MTSASLVRWNGLDVAEAEAALLTCCASRRWAAAVAAERPYETLDRLLDIAERRWWDLDAADWDEAFAAHPRIGDHEAVATSATVRREQAGVAGATEATLHALAAGNRRYEARFGRVFLICASGRGAGELLDALIARLDNPPETELEVAAGEQARITRLRLERLFS